MNNNQNIQRDAIVKGFSHATPDLLEQIRTFFGIESDVKALSKAQRYFATVELRDPYVEELRLIDKMLSSPKTFSENLFLTELFSEDQRVGEAYNDMRNKLRSLMGNYKVPYSIETLLLSGNFCLSVIGKRNVQSQKMFSGDDALLNASIRESKEVTLIKSASGKHCAIVSEDQYISEKNKISDSDCFIFIKAGSQSTEGERFASILAGLMIINRKSANIKALKKISEVGLLDILLDTVKGAFLNLSPLSSFYNINTDFLLTEQKDAAVAVISSAGASRFIENANMYGLYACIIGRPSNAARLTIISGGGTSYSFATDFLKSLKAKTNITAKIKSTPVSTRKASEKFAISTMSSGTVAEYTALQNGMLITNASSSNISFNGALDSTLEAICRLVSCGAEYQNILASFDVGISANSEYTLGDGIAMLMGIYRIQAELCIVSSGSNCKITPNPYFSITLLAQARGEMPKNHFIKRGSRVYLLAPRYNDDGLPNFNDERLLLSYVNRLFKEKAILSARAVGTDGVEVTVSKMKTDTVNLKITQKSEKAAVGSFVVESDSEISGFLLGYTE